MIPEDPPKRRFFWLSLLVILYFSVSLAASSYFRVSTASAPVVTRYYQGGQPACSGHAGAWFKSYLDYLTLRLSIARSPRQIYSICKRDDGIPENEGTYLRQIFKTLKSTGVCELSLHPNQIELPKSVYRDPLKISPVAFADAFNNKAGAYATLNDLSFTGLQDAIFQNSAVILLIYCDDGFFGTTTPTFTTKSYGHFVVACQYDQDNIYVIDSTEKNTSLSLKAINKKYINGTGFIREGGTAINIPNWQLIGLTSKNDIIRYILQGLIGAYTKLLSA